MPKRSLDLDDRLYDYLLEASLREPEILRRLREETAAMPLSMMQIAPEQGQFMGLIVELIGARQCLELGVFTGYSSLVVALALPDDGHITACDVSEEFTAVARRYWAEAGIAHKIDLRLAPGLDTLDALLAEGADETYDFAFVDAVKTEYADYYERLLKLIRPGGLIAVDNVLWGGAVADPDDNGEDTVAIRAFNEKLRDDPRVTMSLLPLADGLTLVRKR
ncbi:MAG: class I SAM-dependent methyltransferase [Alphaproteobacteria bacterium]|jgi:caffeoyl-CoA O-methyltransferase